MSEKRYRVHLTSAYPYSTTENFGCKWLVEHSAPLRNLVLVDSADDADVIIFIENHPGSDPYFWKMFSSPAYKSNPSRCVLYHDADLSVTTVRTISPSIERWQFNPNQHRSLHYVARLCANDVVDRCTAAPIDSWKYLYSFIGSVRTHPIRRDVMRLRQDDAFVLDTSGQNAWEMDAANRAKFHEQFARVCADSAFVLCPRGIGPATYRLFETMQMGRVAVVISDEWVPPAGVDWNNCVIFVAERDVHHIPAKLAERAGSAAAMGKHARNEWERVFSPANSLQMIAEAAIDLVNQPDSLWRRFRAASQFRRPYHFKGLVRTIQRRMRT